MASNYDMPRLVLGQTIGIVAAATAVVAAARCVSDRAAAFIPLAGIILAYGVMMFASSYVEEEHHFWYWATTAWFAYLGLTRFKRYAALATHSHLPSAHFFTGAPCPPRFKLSRP